MKSGLKGWLAFIAWALVGLLLASINISKFVLSLPARALGLLAKPVGRLFDRLSVA